MGLAHLLSMQDRYHDFPHHVLEALEQFPSTAVHPHEVNLWPDVGHSHVFFRADPQEEEALSSALLYEGKVHSKIIPQGLHDWQKSKLSRKISLSFYWEQTECSQAMH